MGKALVKELDGEYDIYGTYLAGRAGLLAGKAYMMDVDNPGSVDSILKDIEPDIIISCLRGSFDGQLEVHNKAAGYLRERCGRMYFCSTANVFDKDPEKPHYEEDHTDAESDYGQYKAQCEEHLRKILMDNLTIFRLPMMWGRGYARPKKIIESVENGLEIETYENLYVNNNTDVFLARQIHYIINNDLRGIFHLGSEVVNYCDFVEELLKRLGYDSVKMKKEVLPLDKYYLAVLSRRKDLPENLKIYNEDILKFLTE